MWASRPSPRAPGSPGAAGGHASRGEGSPARCGRSPSANLVAIVWLWVGGGNVSRLHSTGDVLTSLARLTGLLGSYSALLQVCLLARIPWLERLAGI